MQKLKPRWDSEKNTWKKKSAEGWIEFIPEIPSWAPDGIPDPEKFICLWASAEFYVDVRKEFFWMTDVEIEERRLLISDWLVSKGYRALPILPLKKMELLSDSQLDSLLSSGMIQKSKQEPKVKKSVEPADEDLEDYDPVQALLDAQDKGYHSKEMSHIHTMEVGPGMRFRAKR